MVEREWEACRRCGRWWERRWGPGRWEEWLGWECCEYCVGIGWGLAAVAPMEEKSGE